MSACKGEAGIFEEVVEEDEELAETGCECDERFLAACEELVVIGLEDAVVADGAESGHEEGAADGAASAGDAARALGRAAVAVVGGDADECGDGLVAEAA